MPGLRTGAGLALGIVLLLPFAAGALPDRTPWGRADGEACVDCHFLYPAVENSTAVSIAGLPERYTPGETYRLMLELEDSAMRRAGFRIIAAAADSAPGRFASIDGTTEADGDRIRSTLAGSELTEAGRARWRFEWRAPDADAAGLIRLDVSANAADDDESPLGDVIHRRQIETDAADPP